MRNLKISSTITQRDGAINRLLVELKKYPPLSYEEEYELGIKKNNGDQEAFDKLVKHNLRFVVSVANKYVSQKGCFSLSDLVSEGTKGLIHAVKKFEPTKGFRLISYAVQYIQASISKFVKENKTIIKHPMSAKRILDTARRTAQLISQEQNYPMSTYDVLMRDSPEWAFITAQEINPLETDDENGFPMIDFITDSTIEAPDEKVMSPSIQDTIQEAMKDFTGLEKDIINYTFGLKGDFLTLDEIAEMWCLRPGWISEKKKRILRRLSNNELLREYYEN